MNRLPFGVAERMTKGSTSVFRGEGTPKSKDAGSERNDDYEDAMVCLTCTKAKCNGGEECFTNRKRQLAKEKRKGK